MSEVLPIIGATLSIIDEVIGRIPEPSERLLKERREVGTLYDSLKNISRTVTDQRTGKKKVNRKFSAEKIMKAKNRLNQLTVLVEEEMRLAKNNA